MNFYQDIRVLEDPEFSEPMLMAALFAKLHRALGAYGQGDVGVSFPRATKTLGDTIRLHGSQQALSAIEATQWLKGLRDYSQCAEILAVPEKVAYRTVSRVQVKSSAERLRRRSVKKGWLTEEQARLQILDANEQKTSLPFIVLKSLSTGQMFHLFICQGELQTQPTTGKFSSYGLSATAMVPWF
ncbi:type I-F CRISPR-associated endoribonuclease Cas6/Csy4 [Hafnia alvei]|uniref:type I-F CRISPR-associated endoribonuclease Cas6/Csy4 n=1 Tax=Hafnia alvei TaxID=569 RepID=UPI00345D1A81